MSYLLRQNNVFDRIRPLKRQSACDLAGLVFFSAANLGFHFNRLEGPERRAAQDDVRMEMGQEARDIVRGIGKPHESRFQGRALTTSEAPLPTTLRQEIFDLVYQYGEARRYASFLPLGPGTNHLPKTGTEATMAYITPGNAAARSFHHGPMWTGPRRRLVP